MILAKIIFNFTMIAGIILGVIFILFTQFSSKRRDKTVVYLNLVVLFITLNNLQIFIIDNLFTDANYFVRKLLIPWYVLILPAFYAFLVYYLKIEKKIYSFVSFSMALFAIELLVRLVLTPNYYGLNGDYCVAKYSQIEEIVNAGYTVFLFFKCFLVLFKYSKLYKYVLSFDNIKWLKTFMFLGSFVILMWICAIVLNIDKVINPIIYIYYPLRFSCSVLLYWIGYQGFYNYRLMTERIELRNLVHDNEAEQKEEVPKEKNSSAISTKELQKSDKFLAIEKYIENNNRFLDSELTLELLASELKLSTSSLSNSINKESSYNFSDYINSLRVEKAKEYLISSDFKKYTILSIGLECGFNSKSTFYSSFKKFTDSTPSEFRIKNS
ncbi:helix-turn-helix domain-containing protein [Flavobacterium sp.]|uniref:helix-turn-helix domain-containing protein n=1 Tax=Flavobacterium sp. TaxID=239 RepID=UPI0037534342